MAQSRGNNPLMRTYINEGQVLLVQLSNGRCYKIPWSTLESFRYPKVEKDIKFQKRLATVEGNPGIRKAVVIDAYTVLDGNGFEHGT
jgi:hypothetical protein